MHFRHETKHCISYQDLLILRQRLPLLLSSDPHAKQGRYLIRSLYFDSPSDAALRQKLDGVDKREKFRIRCYDHDHSLIRLEKKSKHSNLSSKISAILTTDEVKKILNHDLDWMKTASPLVQELYVKMTLQQLRPRTIVDYFREPFVCPYGNVRVTLDYDLRTGLRCADFLDPHCPTIPAEGNPIILEVKWDNFLPDHIRSALGLKNRRASAFSKYAQCRVYD